ncbi:Mob1/phocein [Eremomyces bilateralis CBS 781.70]|uniref:Mob1/phocein n=1 Tax=Eremomyces bilateralis CBS 781.70 TaxID=1392243 RepID=A0A6G1G7R4_9PEZI|nr:Mob1/phocein [Eremomyces bilateralis CBS 781.70]KAF1814117.1 Mob1/phocein [Eremomyces bilateralis CBS 781.70]
MASFFSSVRGFGRASNKNGNNPARGNGQQAPSPTGYAPSPSPAPPSIPPVPASPALSAGMSVDTTQPESAQGRKTPFFFREEYSAIIVKGNFMTLAAKPQLVEEGEWFAHQVVEQYRLLDSMIQVIKCPDERTGEAICNEKCCPTMSAAGHTYTWLDNLKRPIKIPACRYIELVQRWIIGKISDPSLFPIDTGAATGALGGINTPGANTPIAAGPTSLNSSMSALTGRDWLGRASGFPENFENDLKSMYRQMMRCYSHLYHGHWVDLWHLSAWKELNTCFIHFINVGKLYGLIGDKETEPMQPLMEIWVSRGLLSAAPQNANTPQSSSRTETPTSSVPGTATAV